MSEFLPVGIGGRWALRERFTRCHGTHMEGPALGLNTIEVEGPVGKTLREAEKILNTHDDLVRALAAVLPYAESRAEDLSPLLEDYATADDFAEAAADAAKAWKAVEAAEAALTKARGP